jgi:hypothetical protein
MQVWIDGACHRRLLLAAWVVPVVMFVCGCGVTAAREDSARTTARAFRAALAAGDGATACDLLAPSTRRAVERQEDSICAAAILDADVPVAAQRDDRRRRGTTTPDVDVYGDQARVVLPGDTLFLAAFARGWRVTAAGCTPRGELPYDCQVSGG